MCTTGKGCWAPAIARGGYVVHYRQGVLGTCVISNICWTPSIACSGYIGVQPPYIHIYCPALDPTPAPGLNPMTNRELSIFPSEEIPQARSASGGGYVYYRQ